MTQHAQHSHSPSENGTGDRWSRRPRRSRNDRKVAGVAGGLGRAFGIDPVVLRIAFVVLAIFGGSGVLLYALCWLLLPADGDEVSAIEAVLGRGRSSVSPMFTVLLIVIALSSAGSVFSWGLPFWPIVIGAIVVFLFARRSRVVHGQRWNSENNGHDWNQWGNDVADRANRWATDFSDRASRWGQRPGQWGGPWGGTGTPTGGSAGSTRSPFDAPPFWDSPHGSTPGSAPAPGSAAPGAAAPDGAATGSAGTESAATASTATGPAAPGHVAPSSATTEPGSVRDGVAADTTATAPSPTEMLAGTRTPPAWDPLGVAPFAWDLPEPSPVPPPPGAVTRNNGRSAVSRVFVGIGLLAGALAAVGVIAGWWALSWAEVSAIALTVVGVGLIIAALRGRGRSLIGPGIFLALLTLALTVTGVNGTQGYGDQTWTPTTVDEVNNQAFVWNAGDGTLDLSGLTVAPGTTVSTTVDVRAGQATVIVPADVTVHATCSANVGQVDCLDVTDRGMRPEATGTQTPIAGTAPSGIIDLTVRVGAGHVTVHHG
jgi:phage shock protein PspC (stress-responsive transcriptional regulator)